MHITDQEKKRLLTQKRHPQAYHPQEGKTTTNTKRVSLHTSSTLQLKRGKRLLIQEIFLCAETQGKFIQKKTFNMKYLTVQCELAC